jgi:stage II sporulation protein D
VRKEHALLLTCACVASLFFNLPSQHFAGGLLSLTTNNSTQDESEIDSALQGAANSALAGRDGTVIVMDAQTGRVRAIVNSEGAYAQALLPGSSIKPFTALAALRAGVIDEDSRTVCPGRFTGLSFSLPCVHADHLPPFSPAQAIAYSCNYYFATLGQRLGRDRLIATLREFDFGEPTGIAAKEVSGIVRPCEMGNVARVRTAEANHASEEADCGAREAIGESDHIQVTPIQLLSAYAALVNGGHLYEPRVASTDNFNPVERAEIKIAAQHRAVITEGMAGAVRYGTARSARFDALPLTILGKTGTAMRAKGFRTNGWFIGFAGAFQSNRQLDPTDVKLAVLVLLARAHGSQAAEIAKPIFEAYANEIGHRGTETQSFSKQEPTSDNSNSSEPPRFPLSASSTIKVHLVHDNLTQELSLEDYVLGVMRAEGTMEDQPEALKALAIAIRTYALKNIGRHAKDGYDFCSTTHCQRFSVRSPSVSEGTNGNGALTDGRASDTRLLAAVRATEGQVLLNDRGQPIDSYFGASCGGETANIGELWGVTPPSYLRGVRDEYCETGPHATWTDTIKRGDLLRALKSDSRTDVGNRLDQILVSKKDETGRAEWITLEGENRKQVRGWDFKIIVGRVLGWNVLKSSRFEVARSGSNFVFRGSGFGHGLGLCQEGAHVMAARGSSYQKILEKYFPGTSLKKDAETRGRGETANAKSNTSWKADLLIDLGSGPIDTDASPRSGEMFIEIKSKTRLQLRRSVMFSPSASCKDSHVAPTELLNSSEPGVNKYSVPPGLVGTNTRFFTISNDHFTVTYPADVDRRDANQVLNTLEATRNEYLHRALSASISVNAPNLEIRLNESTGDFTSRTGQPWWAAAATKGNRIELQPVAILKRRGVLFTTLRHELAHVVIDSASNNRAPRWLEEGFAIYLAGEGKLFSHYQPRGALSNEELEKRLERPGSQQDMRALYAQAYASVAELVRTQGEASVWKKLAAS